MTANEGTENGAGSDDQARRPYRTPRLAALGSAATITKAVSRSGLMDGWMGRRTG